MTIEVLNHIQNSYHHCCWSPSYFSLSLSITARSSCPCPRARCKHAHVALLPQIQLKLYNRNATAEVLNLFLTISSWQIYIITPAQFEFVILKHPHPKRLHHGWPSNVARAVTALGSAVRHPQSPGGSDTPGATRLWWSWQIPWDGVIPTVWRGGLKLFQQMQHGNTKKCWDLSGIMRSSY